MTHEDIFVVSALFGVAPLTLITSRTREEQHDRTLLFWMSACIALSGAVYWGTLEAPSQRSLWILAVLPTLMLSIHAAFLFYVRSNVVPKATPEVGSRL